MLRDIDYGALAVRKQIEEKFGRQDDLADLEVRAEETTILVEHGKRRLVGTRDNLLAALRKATTYEEFLATPQQSALHR
jgi:hypothetical protein